MRRAVAGFTLAEVFTAILVIAIGLVGIAALYGETAQPDPKAEPRTTAEQLAQTIAERVKSNSAGRQGYASIVGVICAPSGKQSTRAIDAAAQEAACWLDKVQRALPNGTGSITRDLTTSPPTYVVAVSWSAPGAGASSYVIRVQPK